MYVIVTPPATEPLTIEEAKQFARLDATNAEPAPPVITGVALAGAGAGNVDNGAHRYLATFVTANGETQAGVVSGAVAVADKTVNGKVQLTGIPLGGSAVTSRKIYRTAAAGAVYMLLTTIADNTTTAYLDNIADAALGAGTPAVNTTGDPLLTGFISEARQLAEQELGRALITQTVDRYLDAFPVATDLFPGREIFLPPIQSVSSIEYVDADGNTVVLDPVTYAVDSVSQPARVIPAFGYYWPVTRSQTLNTVKVRFVAGYGAAAAVPTPVKHWIALHVKAAWDNRDKYVSGAGMTKIPSEFVDGLLDRERYHGRKEAL